MSAHTPGPWKRIGRTTVSNDEQTIGIADIRAFSISTEEAEANANLIALAPEMLAALEEINNVALGQPYAGCTCGEIARAILVKVKGEAS